MSLIHGHCSQRTRGREITNYQYSSYVLLFIRGPLIRLLYLLASAMLSVVGAVQLNILATVWSALDTWLSLGMKQRAGFVGFVVCISVSPAVWCAEARPCVEGDDRGRHTLYEGCCEAATSQHGRPISDTGLSPT